MWVEGTVCPMIWRLESELNAFGELKVVQSNWKGGCKAEGREVDSTGCKRPCIRGDH